jgi:hypothetical protein
VHSILLEYSRNSTSEPSKLTPAVFAVVAAARAHAPAATVRVAGSRVVVAALIRNHQLWLRSSSSSRSVGDLNLSWWELGGCGSPHTSPSAVGSGAAARGARTRHKQHTSTTGQHTSTPTTANMHSRAIQRYSPHTLQARSNVPCMLTHQHMHTPHALPTPMQTCTPQTASACTPWSRSLHSSPSACALDSLAPCTCSSWYMHTMTSPNTQTMCQHR